MNMNFILYLYRYMSLRMCVCKRIFWCMYMYMCMSCVVIVKAIQSYPLGWLWRHMNSGNRAGSLVYFFWCGTNENVKHPNPCNHSAMVHAPWRWCRKNPVKAGAVCFHILSWVWTMTDTEHTRDARDVRDTRDPNMRCCVTLFGLTSPRQQFDSNCDTWSGKSNGNGFEDCKVEMCWAVQGCAGFVPRRCLWASARFTVRTLFHCDLMSVPWQRQIFELTNLYDFFKDPTKRKMKGMIIG